MRTLFVLSLLLVNSWSVIEAININSQSIAQPMEPTWIDFASSPLQKGDEMRFSEKTQTSAPARPHKRLDYMNGCVDVPLTLCVGMADRTGMFIFGADNVPKRLSAYFPFDDEVAQDQSGNLLTPHHAPQFGPGFAGNGRSAHFRGSDFMRIPHHSSMAGSSISISFFFFLIDQPFGGQRTIFYKGDKEGGAPHLFISDSQKLNLQKSSTSGKYFESQAIIPLRRWCHVHVNIDGVVVQIYINGFLDSVHMMESKLMPNKEDVYIGSSPFRMNSGVKAYIDELKIFGRALSESEVQATAWIVFPGMNPNNYRLGCLNCDFKNGLMACPEHYSMCSKLGLKSGGYAIAREMGWVKADSIIWSSEMKSSDDTSGVTICCADS